uniref:Uncharacterized protein n=1 Tax=Anguilla anguilla TaxID=7936 RepID=A0A0E9UQT9_ANGAN
MIPSVILLSHTGPYLNAAICRYPAPGPHQKRHLAARLPAPGPR